MRLFWCPLAVTGGDEVTASFTVTNTGDRAGADVPQVYMTEAPGERRMRLVGFERMELQPGETRTVTITVEPRLLARFDGRPGNGGSQKACTASRWPGRHQIMCGPTT